MRAWNILPEEIILVPVLDMSAIKHASNKTCTASNLPQQCVCACECTYHARQVAGESVEFCVSVRHSPWAGVGSVDTAPTGRTSRPFVTSDTLSNRTTPNVYVTYQSEDVKLQDNIQFTEVFFKKNTKKNNTWLRLYVNTCSDY